MIRAVAPFSALVFVACTGLRPEAKTTAPRAPTVSIDAALSPSQPDGGNSARKGTSERPLDSPPQWTKVLVETAEDFSFGFLSIDGDRWFAPGRGVIIEGQEPGTVVARHSTPGHFIQRVGFVAGDTAVAVGSPLSVWEKTGATWRQKKVRGRLPAEGRFRDLLADVSVIRDRGEIRFVAAGPVTLAERSTGGEWRLVPQRAQAELMPLVRSGPREGLRCEPVYWRWFGEGNGWYLCPDGRSFTFDGTTNVELPPVPPACADQASGSNVTQAGIAFVCGERVMTLRAGTKAWASVPMPEELHSVALGPTCTWANSRSTIWRVCAQ